MPHRNNHNSCDVITSTPGRHIGPTRRSVSGHFSFRGEVSIPYESTLERDFLIRREFNESVLSIEAQPFTLHYRDRSGHARRYTPDFLVIYRQENQSLEDYPRPELVEIKPEKEWRQNWRKWLPSWRAAWRYGRDRGWCFHIYDESRIRGPVLDNIRFLKPYAKREFPAEETRLILDDLQLRGVASLDLVLARHFPSNRNGEGLAHLWHLLATHQISCDMRFMRDWFTEVWVTDQ